MEEERELANTPPLRLLITGGTGYLGTAILRQVSPAWDVAATCFSQPPSAFPVQWAYLDLRDPAAVDALIEHLHPNVIIHTAALNPGQGADFEAINTDGTRTVARAAARMGSYLIHLSTDVVFDGESGPYDETASPRPIFPYGESKARAEAEVQAAGGKFTIVRTSLIYGWQPPDRHTREILAGLQSGNPPRLFTDEWRCPIWNESLAAALIELTGLPSVRPGPPILHVAGAQALSRYEFGTRLARFHRADPAAIRPALSSQSGLRRPHDCTLDTALARSLLRTPLPGVDGVLTSHNGVCTCHPGDL